MRKLILALMMLSLPALGMAQGTLTVSSSMGSVEWKPVTAAKFAPLTTAMQMVHVGDQIKTGPGSQLILTLPDSSYMVVSENSTITIQEFWAPGVRGLVNLMMGKVRFYIQKLGGKPNPYSIQTPTALIAVRGTTFDVAVDESNIVEVECFEGRVTVENLAMHDREVILDPGFRTIVRPSEYPVIPVAADQPLNKNRVVDVVRRDEPVLSGKDMKALDRLVRDNDRRNRQQDPLQAPGGTTTTDTQRAKPGTLKYPPLN